MGNCLTPTKVDLETQIGNINNKAQFTGQEFNKVFELIYKKQNIEEYYSVRYLSKIHQSKFEKQFHTTFINYEDLASHPQYEFDRVKNSKVIVQYKNLKQLVESEFSGSVKYLNVTVELQDNSNQFNDLRFISTKYLPNIKQVNVIFTNRKAPRYPPPEFIHKYIYLNESLIFRRVNFVCEDKEYLFQKNLKFDIRCNNNNNIEIINCNFDSVALQLCNANKVTILNSSFKNVGYRSALYIWETKSQVTIKNIKILDCVNGMYIYDCNNPIINNLKIENCSGEGCWFQEVEGASLSNANIASGSTGIYFRNCNNAKILDCTIKDFYRYGIFIANSIVDYKRIDFQRSFTTQNNNRDFVFMHGSSRFSQCDQTTPRRRLHFSCM